MLRRHAVAFVALTFYGDNRSVAYNKEKEAMEDRKANMIRHGVHGHLANRLLRARDDSRQTQMLSFKEKPENVLVKAVTSNNVQRPLVLYPCSRMFAYAHGVVLCLNCSCRKSGACLPVENNFSTVRVTAFTLEVSNA